jgi:hypothetical protein
MQRHARFAADDVAIANTKEVAPGVMRGTAKANQAAAAE